MSRRRKGLVRSRDGDRKRQRRELPPPAEPLVDFTRGFVASGLLSALQDRVGGDGARRIDGRRTLRHALQGGAALAAGSLAASALGRHDYLKVAASALGGAAAIVIIEDWLGAAAPAYPEEI